MATRKNNSFVDVLGRHQQNDEATASTRATYILQLTMCGWQLRTISRVRQNQMAHHRLERDRLFPTKIMKARSKTTTQSSDGMLRGIA